METNNTKFIYLFRHPETMVSKGVCYGNSDVVPDGEQLQIAVEKIKAVLNETVPDIVYSSPLTRCCKLAEALAGGTEITVDNLIREIDFGKWEMVPWEAIPEEEREAWGLDFINNKVHGGENFYDVQNRVIQFLEKIVKTNDKTILAITHAGLLRALLAYLLEASPRKIFAVEIDYGNGILIKWDNEEYYKIKFL
jgi:alpha-ribazole phosphatase